MIDWKEKTYFVSGIDTGIGKTVATGMLARLAHAAGKTVLTQKPVQTGCSGIAEDIVMHRAMQGIALTPADHNGSTASYCLPYPASPHLAARLAGKTIDCRQIDADTEKLRAQCDVLLIEGAGGLMVPLSHDTLLIDFIRARDYPLILVTCGRLGSINHTLLSLAVARQYGVRVAAVVYNRHFDQDSILAEDAHDYLASHVRAHFSAAGWLDLASGCLNAHPGHQPPGTNPV